MILQNILGRVVSNIFINISPSNIMSNMLMHARFNKKCQAAFDRC